MKESEVRPQELFNRYLELSRQDIDRFFQDRSQFVAVHCPACDEKSQEPGIGKFGFQFAKCAACGSLYVSPRPTQAQLSAYYRDAESVKFWSTHFYRETAKARREQIFRPRAQLLAKLVEQAALPGGGTFVDIGSGYGLFLEEVRDLEKFEVIMGVEPNPQMAEIGRQYGFPIVQKRAEEVGDGEVQAEFASAFEVLEHVFSPLEFLKAARRLLKPGGRLLFTTLTVDGFDIQVLWEQSKSVYPPHHINLLSVEGMRRLVARSGLTLLELSTPGQLDVDIVANMLKENPDLVLPRFVHRLLQACDEGGRQEFQRFLSANCLSSHARVVACG